jgi:hypothetical protein
MKRRSFLPSMNYWTLTAAAYKSQTLSPLVLQKEAAALPEYKYVYTYTYSYFLADDFFEAFLQW